ncbi:tetratricopeptide repeat protein [Kitasatospora sp. NPDC001683]
MHDQVGNTVDNSTVQGDVYQAQHLTVHRADRPAVQWPMVIGRIPPRATAFQPREELRQAIDAAREQCGTIVLSQVLAGGGGVGKSQLAAHYAREAVDSGVELVLWLDAAEPAAVTDRYARAAVAVGAPGVTGTAEEDAERFLAWLASTDRSWLIVLDNATEHTGEELWPGTSRGGRGRVIATTRHRGAVSSGGNRMLVEVSTYSPAESAAYLRERMERAGCAHLLDEHAADLAEALGHLPLALAHAAAYLINTRRSSGRYLQLFRNRSRTLDTVLPARSDADGYRGPITAALLLSLDAAQREEPVGLARPALELAALLDPGGHPQALWATRSALDHLGSTRGTPVDVDEAHDALAVLHNYNLITLTESPHREVTLHALTARATLDGVPADRRPHREAAEALLGLWPGEDHDDRDLAAVLRTNTDALADHTGDLLWGGSGAGEQLLHRSGLSLLAAGLYLPGIAYWSRLAATSERLVGPHDPGTFNARHNLAHSYHLAGRTDEAIELQERLLADRERVLDTDHPDTMNARNNLAASYYVAGRIGEAIELQERLLADRERVLDTDHPHTMNARNNLAASYYVAGRIGEAIELQERVLADRERMVGTDHPDTLTTRNNLATYYANAGRFHEAIELEERVLADQERMVGTDHPDTLTTRNNLATYYGEAGRTSAAIALLEEVHRSRERILGADHPDTHSTLSNLATSYLDAGRYVEAVALLEQVHTGLERIVGADHPNTLNTRANLAISYQIAGRTDEASSLLERLLADRERLLGTDHPDTLNTRANLATAYQSAGRTDEAVSLQERVLADRERLLGTDHPKTLNTRANLGVSYWEAGRRNEGLQLLLQALAAQERVLGTTHPSTVGTRQNLLHAMRGQTPGGPGAPGTPGTELRGQN